MTQTFHQAEALIQGLEEHTNIQKIELNTPGAFLLKNFLTPNECQYIKLWIYTEWFRFFIDETEKIQYSSLQDEYNPRYRDNDRCVALSLELARRLYERIKPFLPEQIKVQGEWDLCGLNEAFRYVWISFLIIVAVSIFSLQRKQMLFLYISLFIGLFLLCTSHCICSCT